MNQDRDSERITLKISRDDLSLINNALNEVCHGVHIDDAEFSTRLGASREDAKDLLIRIGQLLKD